MIDSITVLIAILATWRITWMITDPNQAGPAAIFERMANYVGLFVDRKPGRAKWVVIEEVKPGSLRELLTCYACLSVVVSVFVFALASSVYTSWIVGCAAISGGSCLVHKAVSRRG